MLPQLGLSEVFKPLFQYQSARLCSGHERIAHLCESILKLGGQQRQQGLGSPGRPLPPAQRKLPQQLRRMRRAQVERGSGKPQPPR